MSPKPDSPTHESLDLQRENDIALEGVYDGVDRRSLLRIPLGLVFFLGSIALSFYVGFKLDWNGEVIGALGFLVGGTLAIKVVPRLVRSSAPASPARLWFGEGVLVIRPADSTQEYFLSEGEFTPLGTSLTTYSVRMPDETVIAFPKRFVPVTPADVNRLVPASVKRGTLSISLSLQDSKFVLGYLAGSTRAGHRSEFSPIRLLDIAELPEARLVSRD